MRYGDMCLKCVMGTCVSVAVTAQARSLPYSLLLTKSHIHIMPSAIWRVQEDNAGRWRDFPAGLASQAEEAFQTWVGEGAPFTDGGFAYTWPNYSRNKFTDYAVAWPDDVDLDFVQREALTCVQRNMATGKTRLVQRIPIAGQNMREVA